MRLAILLTEYALMSIELETIDFTDEHVNCALPAHSNNLDFNISSLMPINLDSGNSNL